MIIYNPLDGIPLPAPERGRPKHCFLMTRLGNPIPAMVEEIRTAVEECCDNFDYAVIDAASIVSGRDFLLKIWKFIASTPLSVGVIHEEIPQLTQNNIFYELGVAQALGKETIIIKSPEANIPSDFIRTEYINFDDSFAKKFESYLAGIREQAGYYETLADQLEKNPILALDYMKRAFLITGDDQLKQKAKEIVDGAGLEDRAANSVELIAADF